MAKIEYNIPSERIPLICTVALQLCPYFLFIISTPDILSAFLATASCMSCLSVDGHAKETQSSGGYFLNLCYLCRSQPKVEID